MICCICDKEIEHMKTEDGEVYWKIGHNARPGKAGRCCTKCNIKVVIPERLEGILEMEKERDLEVKHG